MMALSDVKSINAQIIAIMARVDMILGGIDAPGASMSLKSVYEDQLLDEIKHLQILVIELTKKVSGDETESVYAEEIPDTEMQPPVPGQMDGESAFAQGELTDKPEEERESMSA